MDPHMISRQRLTNQRIAANHLSHPTEVVRYMGAIQAQHYPMSRWAVGLRLIRTTDKEVKAAVDRGEILRTHLLRPTWHLVCPEDIGWMVVLTAPRIRTTLRSRHKQLGITPALAAKSNDVIARRIHDHGHQTRAALTQAFGEEGLPLEGNRMAHYLMLAELDQVICSGRSKGKQQTYALWSERIAKQQLPDREEALAELARRYFRSRGPATIEDFTWWSGLTRSDAKRATDICHADFEEFEAEGRVYLWTPAEEATGASGYGTFLLPAYDEFVIAYTDRSACLRPAYRDRTISRNGVFWPLIIRRGRVEGIWKRTTRKSDMAIDVDYFGRPSRMLEQEVSREWKRLASFYNP
jgi:hypothetical protein